jgi:hypothetical protein
MSRSISSKLGRGCAACLEQPEDVSWTRAVTHHMARQDAVEVGAARWMAPCIGLTVGRDLIELGQRESQLVIG